MLLHNIYGTDITHDDHHLRSSYFYCTGHWTEFSTLEVAAYLLGTCAAMKQTA
jgi:hypothetical protein